MNKYIKYPLIYIIYILFIFISVVYVSEASVIIVDDFNTGTLDTDNWFWIRENPTHWIMGPTYLQINCTTTDMYQSTETAPLLLRNISTTTTNTTISTNISAVPDAIYEGGGLIFYADDDNFVALQYYYSSTGRKVLMKKEDDNVQVYTQSSLLTSDPIYLRIDRVGTNYSGYYSTDNSSWNYLTSYTISDTMTDAGLFAPGVVSVDDEPFKFDYFYITEPWWNESWAYYKTLAINQSMVNQSIGTGAFPVLVSITDSNLSTYAQSDGDDIVFINGWHTTQLPHEIEYWNATTGVLVAWVGVDDIKNVSYINIYYNNTGAINTENASGVWDNNYIGVWHMNESSGIRYDSTSNDNDLSDVNTVTRNTGKIGFAADFETTNTEYLERANADLSSNFPGKVSCDCTVSTWVNYESITAGHTHNMVCKGSNIFYLYELDDDDIIYSYISGSTANTNTSNITNSRWYYVVMRYDGSNLRLYLNGSPDGNEVALGSFPTDTNPFRIGTRYLASSTRSMDGLLDDVRISNISRSDAYIETDYNNTAYPSLFFSVSEQHALIESEISIFKSITPSLLYTNYTGDINISYLVSSTYQLNLSNTALLYGINYTITGDMQNYIAVPPNDIAYNGIYRALHRNLTPYLSWEFNDTITEGNVWKWGGYDNDSIEVSTNVVNSTHTYINITTATEEILPSSYYISRTAIYDAPKTEFEINRQQGLIFKTWNLEEIRGRDSNYFANLYFDSDWESTIPDFPITIGYCNNSYNPAIDDIDTSQYCTQITEWTGDRWVNYSWTPTTNSSYAIPLTINGSVYSDPELDEINYMWLRSYALSSKSYVLNATNYNPSVTNISFADTNTMWTYNELTGTTTPVAYTPSFFSTYARNYEELLHHIYVTDIYGTWAHSDIFNETIGISSVPVEPVNFKHFDITCRGIPIEDYLMDATYNNEYMGIYIYCPPDLDGGTVSHNLTLHYANQSLVSVINDTFSSTGGEFVTINFSTTPHYSSSELYTLRCISTDDEDDVATRWLPSFFSLDADGSQGHIVNAIVRFWGMNDIPTLYSVVANDSLISYNGGSDVYTMHVPFFKSKNNDTFYFNETVHLESLNNEDVAYFRFIGDTIFNYANIYAWNTSTDSYAPNTDMYRGFVYSQLHTHGNITNSDFSYLGSDFYRREGINFIENIHDYWITNSSFSNNAEGLIMEYGRNTTIINSTFSNNDNVGIGIYYQNNTTVYDSYIYENNGRGISIYSGFDNIVSGNTIYNNGIHGIHLWAESQNNSCIENDVFSSSSYDYFLSSDAINNYIIDPASSTNEIRITSTSDVVIENTDNSVFEHDSLNTTYAYGDNFSMYVSGVSQTFDITQRNFTIVPSNDNLSIENFVWGSTVEFDAESTIGVNYTWFNLTNTLWSDEQILIYVDNSLYNTSDIGSNGTLNFNYTESIEDDFFEFVLALPPAIVPISIFIFMGILLFVFCATSIIFTGIPGIFSSIVSVMLSFVMSKIAINGSLSQNIGGISDTGEVIQGVTTIEIPALSYILLFVGIFMCVIFVIQVFREIKFRESEEIIELDL